MQRALMYIIIKDMDKETIVQLLADGVISNEVAAKYFPELKENEDEKVKKELVNAINLAYDCGIAITKENRDKYLAWIEKQGGQKVEVKYVYTKFRIGDVIVEIKPNGYCQPVTVKHVGKWAYSCESDDGKRSLSFPITSQDEYKLVEQKPTNVCEGCNNVKGCIACVDGSEWAHIEEAKPTAWSEEKPTKEIEPFEAEHGKYYYCIKDYFCGGKKQASKGDVVQALRGLPIMGLKDASEYFLPVNSIKCNSNWSEEDEEIRVSMIEDYTEKVNSALNAELATYFNKCIDFLKNKNRYENRILFSNS